MKISVSVWHEKEAVKLVADAGFDGIDLPICDFGNVLPIFKVKSRLPIGKPAFHL